MYYSGLGELSLVDSKLLTLNSSGQISSNVTDGQYTGITDVLNDGDLLTASSLFPDINFSPTASGNAATHSTQIQHVSSLSNNSKMLLAISGVVIALLLTSRK